MNIESEGGETEIHRRGNVQISSGPDRRNKHPKGLVGPAILAEACRAGMEGSPPRTFSEQSLIDPPLRP